MQIRCNFPDISYLSETQKNNFQFLKQNAILKFLIATTHLLTKTTQEHVYSKDACQLEHLSSLIIVFVCLSENMVGFSFL